MILLIPALFFLVMTPQALAASPCETVFGLTSETPPQAAAPFPDTREILAIAHGLITGHFKPVSTQESLHILQKAHGILAAAGVQTVPALVQIGGVVSQGLAIRPDSKSFLGRFAGFLERRTPGTRLEISLMPHARGYVEDGNVHVGLSLEAALKAALGDKDAWSVVIHELTHYSNFNLLGHSHPVLSARGQLETIDFHSSDKSPLPGAGNSHISYTRYFRLDEITAHETQARWKIQQALRGAYSVPLETIPRQILEPHLDSLEIFAGVTRVLAPHLEKIIAELRENPDHLDPDSALLVRLTNAQDSFRFARIGVETQIMADRPQRVAVIDFRAPNAFDIPVSVFTMAVPLSTPKGEFSPRATSQELLNLLVKLQTYIPKHHARLAAWKDIFRSELADMPLTEIEIKRFFEN